jgi:RNA polymerase sigma-70 factor, ECF subfamily
MVGSVADAEDIVQEALLRFHRAAREADIESPKAYLSAVTTRLAIDHLRSARVQREQYLGQWLPEPLLTDRSPDAADHAETADSLSPAFLVLLESLSPVARAVFLLGDVFGYGFAEVVGKSEDNCRQIAVRARRHVEERRPRFDAPRKPRDELARRFFEALEDGDTKGLIGLLAADVVVYGDGGGKASSWPRPIDGRERVAKLLGGLGEQMMEFGIHIRCTEINGQPGTIFLDADARLTNVFVLDIADGVVQTIRSIINPDKLGHLGPVADVRRFMRERRAP